MGQRLRNDRVGETNISNEGYNMLIIAYRKSVDIDVKFDNGYIATTRYECFEKGEVSNPYHRSVYGVGYVGVGKHISYVNGKLTKKYEKWCDIFKRSYAESKHKKFPTYIGCSVDPSFHCFQDFGDWWDENYKDYMETWHLDKDILIKGNKTYSPDTCELVPHEINGAFTKTNRSRGKLPIGVSMDRTSYRASVCRGKGNERHTSNHKTLQEAFQMYKTVKEEWIAELAHTWKNKISKRLYEAMINYEVEITD